MSEQKDDHSSFEELLDFLVFCGGVLAFGCVLVMILVGLPIVAAMFGVE